MYRARLTSLLPKFAHNALMNPPMKNAVVLVSGGMDSAVVLALARARGFAVHALSVRYGQRHTSELDAAERVARSLGAVAHKTVSVDLGSLGGSALTDETIRIPLDPPAAPEAIPSTYVPPRHTTTDRNRAATGTS